MTHIQVESPQAPDLKMSEVPPVAPFAAEFGHPSLLGGPRRSEGPTSMPPDLHAVPDEIPRRHRRRPLPSRARLLRGGGALLSVSILVALWQLAVTVLHPNALAIVGPWQVVLEAKSLWQQGALGADLRVSGEEVGLGFLGAAVLGVALGAALGVSRKISAFFDPWVTIFYTVPVIAIAPMIIIGLGITLTAKVIIVGSASFFPILLNTQSGIRNLDGGLTEVADAFRASRYERLRYVLIPGSVPYTLTGIRLGVGRGLIALVAGDLFGATKGIGYLILSGEQTLNTAGVYVGVALLSIIGLLLTHIAKIAERHFATYRLDEGGRR